jgi:hypothetical protein
MNATTRALGCFIHEPDGELGFSEKHTRMYSERRRNPARTSGIQSGKEIFGIENDAARMVGHGFFECDEDRLEVYT